MNKPPKNYWKIAIGAIMAFGVGTNVLNNHNIQAGGETSVYVITSIILFLVGLYLLYTGFNPKE